MSYIKYGKIYKVTSREALNLQERLPADTLVVKQNPQTLEYYLEQVESFTAPAGKVFGDLEKTRDRILRTFLDRNAKSTGVMLVGEKGSGKSLLAKMIARKAAEQYMMPVIIINSAFYGEEFNSFIQGINQPAVIMLDEFEKVYRNEELRNGENPQEQVLTLLDGMYPTQKLFLVTCNNEWAISSLMRNRPGRIYYNIRFTGLAEDFIREYCTAKLQDQTQLERIVVISKLFANFNFDMLQALVEEMNRFGESPDDALKFLNIVPNDGSNHETFEYSVEVTMGDGTVLQGVPWRGNPLAQQISVSAACGWHNFVTRDLIDIDLQTSTYTYLSSEGRRLVLKKSRNMLDFSVLKLV